MNDAPSRILNVDDDEANRYAITRILQRAGYAVVEASTGEDALREAQSLPDLILLDVKLPDIHGFEVCRRLREDEKTAGISIVHLTAHARESGDRASGLEGGADAYLTQPVQPRELLATVAAMLRVRQAEQNAREVARAWQTTFNAITDAICLLDVEGRVVRCNPAAQRLVRKTSKELLNVSICDLARAVLGIDVPFSQDELREATTAKVIELSAGDRCYQATLDPVPNEKGELEGAVLVLSDITDRKKLEEELRMRAEQLEIADTRKNEFLAMLAHELRNPLGAIQAAIELLEEGVHDEGVQVQQVIRRQLGNLKRHVDDLLDVSRITRGKVRLQRNHADLRTSAKNAVDAAQRAVHRAGHVLTVSLPNEPIIARIDATRIEQVVTNLLDNAIKYTDPGGRISVELESIEIGGQPWAELRVSDTGAGIPAERLQDIFDLFVQYERTLARSRGGLGLGLTLVKRLVEMHEGTVEVSSPGPMQGSVFTVRLPLATRATVSVKPPPPTNQAARQPRRVLLVEDNDDLRQLLAWKLRRCGHDVRDAADGAVGLALAKEMVPDIVLLDVGLPRVNGYDVAKALRDDPRTSNIHLVALTGYGGETDRERSMEAGFNDHLVKPVGLNELLELLDRVR